MLRKLLFASSLLLCQALPVWAQDPNAVQDTDVKRIRFGMYAAPTISWMHPTTSKTDDGTFSVESGGSRVGYAWGLLADYFFTDNYGIATGFTVNKTGGKIIARNNADVILDPNTVVLADFDYNLQFLEVPFNLKLRTDNIGQFRFFGQVGLSGCFNIGKKVNYEVDFYNDQNVFSHASGEREKLSGSFTVPPFMLQLNAGAGIEYPISDKLTFYTGVFYNNNFLPDATNPKRYYLSYDGVFQDGNVRLNNLALRLGLIF